MKNKTIIATKNAPSAIGPYSQGVKVNDLFYFSGQIPLNPQTMEMTGTDIAGQTTQVLKNIDALLTSQNLTKENVIKTTVFLSDLKNFEAMNKIYADYFNSNPPARSCVEISRLPKDALVEIEVIAHA